MVKLISILAILLLAMGENCFSQERDIAPYLGISGSLDTNGDPGWGIEGGISILPFYIGLEYGTYSYRGDKVLNYYPVPGHVPLPFPVSTEEFFGFHAGYVFSGSFYLGIVFLKSQETWRIATTDSTSYDELRSYLNIGPDFRYSGLANGHMYLAFALTIRRGLKAGLGYMF